MSNKINICHISDLHFGKYENKSFTDGEESFSVADSLIEFISRDFKKEEKPHFLIISGDLTSVSANSEYEEFLQFFRNFRDQGCFAECKIYDEIDRTIIVPGNHDTVRELEREGKFGSDKLDSFERNMAKMGFNTPWGNERNCCFEINDVEPTQVKKSCPIPCALYYYPEYNIVFHTLVSCYFSHKFNPKIHEIYKIYIDKGLDNKTLKKFEKDIEKIIYEDYGHFPLLYRRKTRKTFTEFKKIKKISDDKYRNLIKFAITHHHVIALESEHMYTKGASEMREDLGKNGVIAVLHGHLHEILKNKYIPTEWVGESSFFPCGTVGAYCRNVVNQFNMIEIKNYNKINEMLIKITCYEVDGQGSFSREEEAKKEPYSNSIKKFMQSMPK